MSVVFDLLFGNGVDVLLQLPRAGAIVEIGPLAKVLHLALRTLPMGNDSFNGAISF